MDIEKFSKLINERMAEVTPPIEKLRQDSMVAGLFFELQEVTQKHAELAVIYRTTDEALKEVMEELKAKDAELAAVSAAHDGLLAENESLNIRIAELVAEQGNDPADQSVLRDGTILEANDAGANGHGEVVASGSGNANDY